MTHFTEHNQEVSITNKIPGTNTTVTVKTFIKKGDNDDAAGSALICYQDPTAGVGTFYTTGYLRFWINQQ